MGFDHNPGHTIHFFDPAFLTGYGNDIQAAVDKPGFPLLQILNKVEFNAIQPGLAPEIGIMRSQNQLLPEKVVFEHERPGPHGMSVDACVTHFFHGEFADNESSGVVGKLGEKEGRGQRLFQDYLNRVGAEGME